MDRFTEESFEVLADCFTRGAFDAIEHTEQVYRFILDVEAGLGGNYLHDPLQTSRSDQHVYYLHPPGLLAIVDRYLRDDGGWLFDLVNIYYDPDAADSEPWRLP